MGTQIEDHLRAAGASSAPLSERPRWILLLAVAGLLTMESPAQARDAVVIDAERRLHTLDMTTGTQSPLFTEPVHAVVQDPAGNWWIALERGEKLQLLWLPSSLKMEQHIELSAAIPADTEKIQIRLGPEIQFDILSVDARRENARQCGDWSDIYLCTEALGWSEPTSWETEVDPQAFGIPLWKPRPPAPTKTGVRPDALSDLDCACWGDTADCGKTTTFGSWELMLVDVECGDLYHPSCVLYDRERALYASSDLSSMTTGIDWKTGAEMTSYSYCGPFLMSPSASHMTNGRGTYCSLGPDETRCITTTADFLGIRGESWTWIHLR